MFLKVRAQTRKFSLPLLIVLAGTFFGTFFLGGSDRLSYVFFDFFQKQTPLKVQNEVALITVDQQTLDRLAEEAVVFPFPREFYGAVAGIAAKYSVPLIIYDILFTESSGYGVADDVSFAKMLAQSGVPAFFPAASESGLTKAPVEPVAQAAAGLGSVNSETDSDGVFRRFLKGNSMAEMTFQKMNPKADPNPPDYMRFYARESFPHQSLYNIIKAWRDRQDGRPVSVDLSKVAGKIWVVGYTASGLYDHKPISLDPQAPGMIIPATSVANVLRGEGLRKQSSEAGYLLCFLFALGVFIFVRLQKMPAPAIFGFLAVSLLLTASLSFVFWNFNTWISPVPLMASAIPSGIAAMIWSFQSVWKERLKFVELVRHSMSPAMVELIRKGEVSISREGELKSVTVMFTDLAGFTELSEKLTPEELVDVLNGYFDEVVNLVTRSSGYVDKFIGDAVMAFWGAPVAQNNHAQLAINAAVQFQKAVTLYNEKINAKYRGQIKLGARTGLHTGVAVVGNIGARERYNYTAIGDTVNLSSRLESLCKHYGTDLIISEECVRCLKENGAEGIFEIDTVIVKGKSKPTRIYTFAEGRMVTHAQEYSKGLTACYSGEWQTAEKYFEKSDFPPARVMLERCRTILSGKELKQWENGVWRHDSK
ncbi:MAG: adenylate/guanylate cyclase domain-containing protein [Proteobacteria bacterium]|nr:adenylate/guanylate cyclase domain-containing protein [Pseudomonadota bacterium]